MPATRPAISSISGSPIPREVTDGEPSRIPLGLYGVPPCPGKALALTVTPTSSKAACTARPRRPVGRRSMTMRWLSVPPVVSSRPRRIRPAAIALALVTTACAYSRKAGCAHCWNITALAAMACICGPPWTFGQAALSIWSACSARQRITPPHGPRIVLWVVKVTKSACGTGLGCAPPATRPAKWAMSTRSNASTSRAISANAAKSRMRGYEL